MNYRNSPLKHMGYSPSQLLNSRICKTKVPVFQHMLQPVLCENVKEKMKVKRDLNQKYFDKNAKILKPLEEGTSVTVFNHQTNTWDPAKIKQYHKSPRSYILQDRYGNHIRRNRHDIKSTGSPFKVIDNPYDSDNSTRDSINCRGEKDSNRDALLAVNNTPTIGSDTISDNTGRRSRLSGTNKDEPIAHAPSRPSQKSESEYMTRSGRLVQKPDRLDL